MKEGESSQAGLLTMEGVTVRQLHRLNAVVKKRMPSITTPALVVHSIEDDITSRWNADYVERKLGGPVALRATVRSCRSLSLCASRWAMTSVSVSEVNT